MTSHAVYPSPNFHLLAQWEFIRALEGYPQNLLLVITILYVYREIIVPVFEHNSSILCTAILNLETLTWSKLTNKKYEQLDEFIEVRAISDDKKEKVYFIGGQNTTDPNRWPVAPLAYRLDVDALEWKKLKYSTSSKYSVQTIPLEYYWSNNWPNLDVYQLPKISKLYHLVFVVPVVMKILCRMEIFSWLHACWGENHKKSWYER